MRSKEQYNEQCKCINQPGLSNSERKHYSKVYGINRSSALVELEYFDMTENLPQDLMHVILEGVFPFHMEALLEYVYSSGILTTDTINSRMKTYPYAYFSDKPMSINGVNIQGTQSGKCIASNCCLAMMFFFVFVFFIFSYPDVGTCQYFSISC